MGTQKIVLKVTELRCYGDGYQHKDLDRNKDNLNTNGCFYTEKCNTIFVVLHMKRMITCFNSNIWVLSRNSRTCICLNFL